MGLILKHQNTRPAPHPYKMTPTKFNCPKNLKLPVRFSPEGLEKKPHML
jgi:hypothetical protein